MTTEHVESSDVYQSSKLLLSMNKGVKELAELSV